jgi:hypothetical protein
MPGLLVVKQTLYDGVLMLVLGLAVAFIYRNAPR